MTEPTTPVVLLCKDCRHFEADTGGSVYSDVCLRKECQPGLDLVRGEARLTFCDSQRSSGGKCGAAGKYWEAR